MFHQIPLHFTHFWHPNPLHSPCSLASILTFDRWHVEGPSQAVSEEAHDHVLAVVGLVPRVRGRYATRTEQTIPDRPLSCRDRYEVYITEGLIFWSASQF